MLIFVDLHQPTTGNRIFSAAAAQREPVQAEKGAARGLTKRARYRCVTRAPRALLQQASPVRPMPLVLRPHPDGSSAQPQSDYLVMSGGLQVGRIYKREFASHRQTQWLWAFNGVQRSNLSALPMGGVSPTLEQARADLKDSWDKWLAWAGLQEALAQQDGSDLPPSSG